MPDCGGGCVQAWQCAAHAEYLAQQVLAEQEAQEGIDKMGLDAKPAGAPLSLPSLFPHQSVLIAERDQALHLVWVECDAAWPPLTRAIAAMFYNLTAFCLLCVPRSKVHLQSSCM